MYSARTPLPRNALLSLLVLAGVLLAGLCAAVPAHAGEYGELLRFPGKGANGKGSELQLEGGETHAFAVNPETGSVYVGDETSEGSEDIRVQGYSSAGAFEDAGTIKRPGTLPKGISGFEGYEGLALAPKERRLYVLATFQRFAEDGVDGDAVAAGALYALSTVPNGAGKLEPATGTGKEGILGTTTTLEANSETQGQALLEPSGLTVDPATGEVLILGIEDEGAGGLHPAVMHVSSTGAVLYTWVDPTVLATMGEEPDSPVVSPGGELFFEAGDELLALPADARSGAPEVVFTFSEPEDLRLGPFVHELALFGEGETGLGGGLSIVSEGGDSEGRLVAFAEIWGMTETGELDEKHYGTLNLHYTEAAEHVEVTESGWSGGVAGEGGSEKVKPCEIGFAGANPSVAAGGDGVEYVLAPAWSEVIELGPGGSGCPAAREAPGGLEATLDGQRVVNPEVGEPVTLTARVIQANVLSVKWVFGDGQQAELATTPGEQTQTAETAHEFVKGGELTVEAIIRTDDLATPELRVKTTLDVQQKLGGSPTITEEPESETVVEGGSAKFEAGASGEPAPTAQWEVSTDKGEHWSALAGETRDTLVLEDVTASQNGYLYRATFSNGVGTPVSTKRPAMLTVETKLEYEERLRKQREEEQARRGAGEERTTTTQSPSPSSEPSGQSASPTPTQGVAGLKEAAPRATLASASLTVNRSGAFAVQVRCPAGVSRCSGTLTLRTLGAVSARTGHGAKRSVLTLASGSFTVSGGATKTITLHLSAAGMRLLASSHSLRARAVVVARNAAGESQSLQSLVTLRPAKRR